MNGIAPNLISQALAAGVVAQRLASRGDVHLAVGLLCQALRLAPEAPLLQDAESWLTAENLRRVGPRPLRKLALTMADLAAHMPRSGMSGNGRLLNLRAGARVLGRGRTCYPDEGNLYVGEAFVRDKLGDTDGRTSVVRDAARHFPLHWSGHGVMASLAERGKRSQLPISTASTFS